MKEIKYVYEPHPVEPERKAQLRAQGYRILDVAFAPEGYVHPEAAEAAEPKPRTRAQK